MPTADETNGASPTGSEGNASQDLDVTAIPADKLESHPYVQELKKKYSAAHEKMDSTNLSKKELQAEVARLKVLAGEEAKQEEKAPEPEHVTKDELKQQIWELQHAKDVEIYGDEEFRKDIEAGIPKDYALKTAKLRFQSNPDRVRLERQQIMASGTAMGTRNLDGDELTPTELKGIAEGLYTKETALKYREIRKARGR